VTVTAPSFRPDIRREVDLIEEVARVEGYDKIPVRSQIELEVRPPNKRQATIRRLARGLCGLGLFETVSITFVTGDRAELFARGAAGHLAVTHSSRKAENALRRSLLPSLLAARRHNETVQVRRADLFEIASVFNPPADGEKLPNESLRLGFVTDGDFREARGIVEQVVALVSRSAKLTFQPADRAEFVAGRGAAILLNGLPIGLIGQVSESARAVFDLRGGVTVAEIDVEPLLVLAGQPKTCTPLARFPAIERDLSILVDEPVAWQQVEQAIRGSAPAELEAIEFADLFRGKQFPAGKKSFTFTLRYRSADGTLTNEQANEFAALAIKALADQTGAALRDK
jgi:phenylalanyl-tRNA synthetase beta chain